MSPSDPTPLAQRLVMAAALAGSRAVGAAEVAGERDASRLNGHRVKAHVAAVLRELDAAVGARIVTGELIDLTALADSIEKGGDAE